ncbi:MAG: DUF748 domain-containing protein [Geobacteraceae bacterium]
MVQQKPEENPLHGRKPFHRLMNISRSLPKALRWGVGIVVTLLLVLFIASYFLDEPLRNSMENKMNSHLKGYSVRLPKLHFQLVGFSLTLKGLTVFQDTHPDPPIAYFPVLRASIAWHEILSGKLVAEFMLDRPEIRIDQRQLKSEAASPVTLKKQGWQQAVEAIYPLKINDLTIRDATINYIDEDPKKPLYLSRLNLKANNIRNVRLPDKVYPSSFHLEMAIFGTGRGVIDGKANFLAVPFPGINARLTLGKVPLDNFKPLVARTNLSLRNGLLSASGEIEYAPNIKKADIKEMTIQGMEINYIHTARTAAAEKRRAEMVVKAARKVGKSEMDIRVNQARFSRCTVGLVNKAARNPYRVYIADADLTISNLSKNFSQGPAKAELHGKFMGNGASRMTAHFRPGRKNPDIDLDVKIEETQMTAINDLLRSYANFDVTAGTFSLYSELHIRDKAISGYVKPFFKGMNVYDRRLDKDKKVFRKMYEMMVGGAAGLLKGGPQGKVATKVDITGTLDKPHTDRWQIIGRLIKNAFFKAILPGFDKEVSGSQKR